MRAVGCVAAVGLAAVLSFVWTPARADYVDAGPVGASSLFFAGTDLWRHGVFVHGGMMWSPTELEREGFLLKLIANEGLYRYRSGALGGTQVIGKMFSAAILPGWRFQRGSVTVTVFGGLDFQRHRLSPDDLSAGLRGNYTGLRTALELWYEPVPNTMLAADGSVSTIGPSYSARALFGWRAFDLFYLGPEVQAFAADDNYRLFRTGLHLTGLRVGGFEWSFGAGWAIDSDQRSGLYGKFGLVAWN